MPNLNDLTALCLPTGSRLAADETQSRLGFSLEGQPLLTLRLMRGPELHVQPEEHFGRPEGQALWAACYWLFARDPDSSSSGPEYFCSRACLRE
ncbi:hypothetical protein OKW11_001297 [Pseudomonas baetica]|nr:hypothetical protein [Pseudomonas baetica]